MQILVKFEGVSYDYNTLQVEEGSTTTSYEPYKESYKINPEYIDTPEPPQLFIDLWESNSYPGYMYYRYNNDTDYFEIHFANVNGDEVAKYEIKDLTYSEALLFFRQRLQCVITDGMFNNFARNNFLPAGYNYGSGSTY